VNAAADGLRGAAQAALESQLGAAVTLTAFAALTGGSSQEAWLVEGLVAGTTPPRALDLVMRRDLGGAFTTLALSRQREYDVLRAAFAGGVLAPEPIAFAPDVAGEAAIFMQRIDGEAVGRRVVTDPALADARAALPAQLGAQLAKIHAIDYRAAGFDRTLLHPAAGVAPSTMELDRLTAELDAIGEPHPAIELGLRWLRRHEPAPPDTLTFVHGDFRIGNVLVDARGLTAVLDWEFAHIGDPAEDAGFICARPWRFGGDALRLGGVGDVPPFLEAYARASGRRLDPVRVAWWEVYGNVKWAIGALGQAHRHLSGIKPSIELASIGRRCAEMEYEIVHLTAAG
jgi:aminoglycoside phosphotransferase (APT) family kinase protein